MGEYFIGKYASLGEANTAVTSAKSKFTTLMSSIGTYCSNNGITWGVREVVFGWIPVSIGASFANTVEVYYSLSGSALPFSVMFIGEDEYAFAFFKAGVFQHVCIKTTDLISMSNAEILALIQSSVSF